MADIIIANVQGPFSNRVHAPKLWTVSTTVALKQSLRFAEMAISAAPVVGRPLGSMVKLVREILDVLYGHHLSMTAMKALGWRVCFVLERVSAALCAVDGQGCDALLEKDLQSVHIVSEKIYSGLKAYYEQHGLSRLWCAITQETKSMIQGYEKELDNVMKDFHFANDINVRTGVQRLSQQMTHLQACVDSLQPLKSSAQAEAPDIPINDKYSVTEDDVTVEPLEYCKRETIVCNGGFQLYMPLSQVVVNIRT